MKYKPLHFNSISPPKIGTITLNKFLGVDFTKADYITDTRRSPDALNTIWGENPYVFDTRPGIKRLYSNKLVDSSNNGLRINGIHIYEPTNEILIHANTSLFRYIGTEEELIEGSGIIGTTPLRTDLLDKPSSSFMLNGKLFILGVGKYIRYYDNVALNVEDSDFAFIPTTVIGREPKGGGTTFEAVNLINKWRKNSFVAMSKPKEQTDTFTGDGTVNEFTLSVIENITLDNTTVLVGGSALEKADYEFNRITAKVKLINAPASGSTIIVKYCVEDIDNPEWQSEYSLDSQNIDDDEVKIIVNGISLMESTEEDINDFSVDRETGIVTFTVAPTNPNKGIDNVIITFAKIIEDYADQINNCSTFGIFGGRNDTRVFLTKNNDYPNTDWQSGLYDPTYFPDTGYTRIGADNTRIMGYVKQYDTQMIIKEGNQQDGSAFLRTFGIDEYGSPVFPVEQGAVGIGAVSERTFAYLQGEPLFLSTQGVIGISGSNVDNQRLMRDKSTLINTVLTAEQGIEDAIGVEHLNKYYLFINGKVFVADCRMRYNDDFDNAQYEWMYWEDVNATAVKVHITESGQPFLLIGYDGMIFRLNEQRDFKIYIDEDSNGNEHNIETRWTTPNFYLGSITVGKRVRDINFLFSKYMRINVRVEAIINNEKTINLGNYNSVGILNFSDVDFGDLTFATYNPTFVYNQRGMIEGVDNIRFKISKITNGDIVNSALGIELLQITYQLLSN